MSVTAFWRNSHEPLTEIIVSFKSGEAEPNNGITLVMVNHVDLLPNLKHTLESAGSQVSDLTQVVIYVTDREDLATVNRVYADFVSEPYPNRAAIIVSGFAREEMLVEILAYAVVP